jgi:hypothetical protein
VRLLGLVDWVNVDKGGHQIAGVEPLFEVTTPEWRAVRSEEFPTQGKVFWFQATADRGTLLYFRAEENTGQFKDEFKVADPQWATEVLDLRTIGSPEEVRQALSAGLHRRGFVPKRALLRCKGELFIGPGNLSAVGTDTYIFEYPQRHKIPCYSKKLDVREVSNNKVSRFVIADSSLGPPDSFVDWDDDRVVVRRAITWAAERARESGVDHNLTRPLIQQAAEQVTGAGTSAELKLEQYRLQRVIDIIGNVKLSEDLAQVAVEALQHHPQIASELDRLRQNVKDAVTTETLDSLQAERTVLESAKQEREQVESEIETKRSELETLQSQVDAKVQEVETEVNRRIGEVLEKPAALLAEVAILREVLRGTDNSSLRNNDSYGVKNPSPAQWSRASRTITDQTDLRKSLVTSSKASGVPLKVSYRIHSAIRAGLLPVLAGPRALNALEAYARVICGGRIFRINVAPSFLEPGNLFGKVDPARGVFLPHPGGLADILESARQSSGLAVVVIEGANRAPTESYLLPVIQCAFGGINLKLFHPSIISSQDAYRGLAEIQWPSNVLLSATIVEGPTTLPLSRSLWDTAVLIETDGETPKSSPAPDLAELDPEGDLIVLTGSPDEIATDHFDNIPGYESLRAASERYLGALAYFEGDEGKLGQALVESTILPVIASIDEDDERNEILGHLIESSKSMGLESAELIALARRIRRRIA